MNRIAAVALAVAMLHVLAFQKAEAIGISRLGVKGGINLARLADNGINKNLLEEASGRTWEQDFQVTKSVGGFVEVGLTRSLALRPEFLLTIKGESYQSSMGEEASLQFSYVEIPLIALYRFPVGNTFRPALFVGSAISYQYLTQLSLAPSIGLGSPRVTGAEAMDFSIIAGGELLMRNFLSLEVRFQGGFVDLYDLTPDTHVTNRAVSFLFGFSFDVSR